MSGCGCNGKKRPVHRTDEATWEQGEFRDTEILHGKYFPRHKIEALSLASGATRKVRSLSDVRQTVYITVLSGILSMWFEGQWSGDTTEQIHMTWSTGPTQELILPPGEHRLVFFADNSAACVATIVILDREEHKDA